MTSEDASPGSDLLASGGGNATAAGVTFQGAVGAGFAAQLLSERRLDERLKLGDVRIKSLRFETEGRFPISYFANSLTYWRKMASHRLHTNIRPQVISIPLT